MRKIILFCFFSIGLFAEKPNLLLLKSYSSDVNVTNWLMSEKLDGVRGYWNGEQLFSRSGKAFAVPKWFTKEFPPFEIDGELWTKRGDFENVISIVNKQTPHDGWKNISYQIFEVPNQEGGLLERLSVLEKWLVKNPNEFIKVLPQTVCKGSEHLKKVLAEVEKKGAEGLVVRDPNALYVGKRSSFSLKVKSFTDDECKVIGYKEGKGKFQGLMGSLICEWKGKTINIGSGFSKKERFYPPKIGTEVTFKFNGLTKYGNPRLPVFLRIRKNN